MFFHIIFMLFVLFNVSAMAYLDPGSGGILFQVLAAIGVFAAILWRKLKRTVKKDTVKQEEVDSKLKDILDKKD